MDRPQPSQPAEGDAFYRRLCENAAVALVVTDERYNIICWNPAATELLGLAAAEMLGKHLQRAVPPPRRKLLLRLLERTTRRRSTSEFEVSLPVAGGQTRELLVVLWHVPGPAGESRGVAAWIIDQTARKRMAQRLRQSEKMASLGTLAGGIAHHFNNILGGVATFVDYAILSGESGEMRRALQMTADAAARAAKITQALLSFAEYDKGSADLSDLTEIVLTFAHLIERPLAQKNIQLQLNIAPIPVTPVHGQRLHHALNNLLVNAQEAMPGGGLVTISLSKDGPDAVLSLADNGPGIAPQHLPLVFEPFFTTKGLLAGGDNANPGLGLSVVHGIITEMGGSIKVESSPGAGARFIMRLPLERPEEEE
jgi:PAS domain S-box-containing protein